MRYTVLFYFSLISKLSKSKSGLSKNSEKDKPNALTIRAIFIKFGVSYLHE